MKRYMRVLCPLAVALAVVVLNPSYNKIGLQAANPRTQPGEARFAEQYERRRIEGWTILINKQLLAQEELSVPALAVLRMQLFQITRKLPPQAVRKLRTIPIWLEENEPYHNGITYHPSLEWLREKGANPAKFQSIDICNIKNFLNWTLVQPWMLLHELSHGYHQKFIQGGFKNPQVKAVYDNAMRERLYDSVLRYNGQIEKAYATTNEKEYFAEVTEAFFGTNDSFPFVNPELKRHDPRAFQLLQRMWGVGQGKGN